MNVYIMYKSSGTEIVKDVVDVKEENDRLCLIFPNGVEHQIPLHTIESYFFNGKNKGQSND